MKDYLKKHEGNRLESEKTEQKLLHSLKKVRKNLILLYFKFCFKVSWTFCRDGFVHFDDRLTLINQKTKGLLGLIS